MTSSNRHSLSGATSVYKRALASIAAPAVLVSVIALLLIAVAACGDDDSGDSASPSASGSASPSDGRETQTPGVEVSPRPETTGSGTATIDGVQYDFVVSTCSIQPELVLVIGLGTGPDGNPLIGTAQWNELDFREVPEAFEVGIGLNAPSLLSLPEQVFKMGNTVLRSTVESVEIDTTAFELTTSGMFVDLEAPEAPPVPGTFSVSCS